MYVLQPKLPTWRIKPDDDDVYSHTHTL